MENLRGRVNIDLVTSPKIARNRIAKPTFKRSKIIRDDLVAIHCAKENLVLNRPIQIGFTVLEKSKHHMLDFHYNVWMKTFPTAKLLFTG